MKTLVISPVGKVSGCAKALRSDVMNKSHLNTAVGMALGARERGHPGASVARDPAAVMTSGPRMATVEFASCVCAPSALVSRKKQTMHGSPLLVSLNVLGTELLLALWCF